jgi:hydrogenase nickel incorporation protein HypB
MCHLDAEMTRQGLDGLGTAGLDLAILENIGNLICTADYDTGAAKKALILSVPEGDDKPLKYPHIFAVADVLLINKIDALGFFEFDIAAVTERVRKLNPQIRVIPISAKTGEGIAEWTDWLRTEVRAWKEE